MLGRLRTLNDTAQLPYYNNIFFNRNFECIVDDQIVDPSTIGLSISNEVLTLIAFHAFNLPPCYWDKLVAKFSDETFKTPESAILALVSPVESVEVPDFYVIPYFNNYLISKCGKLLKRSTGEYMNASEALTGYYTFRMTDDSNKTYNALRHRVLCIAHKPYSCNVNTLDVNHLNGIPGSDELHNLEWATRTRNIEHAFDSGLRTDNIPVKLRDIHTDIVYLFRSQSEAGSYVGVTGTTVGNRIKKGPEYVHDGYQYMNGKSSDAFPTNINKPIGNYLVEKVDGTKVRCGALEASRLLGLTRTSLHRSIREGRYTGKTGSKIIEYAKSH